MKENYHKLCLEELSNITKPKKILLHSCCAPCSSYVITFLSNYFDITILYYNPNIYPFEEYEKRKKEQIKLINTLQTKNKLDYLDCDYDNNLFHENFCLLLQESLHPRIHAYMQHKRAWRNKERNHHLLSISETF